MVTAATRCASQASGFICDLGETQAYNSSLATARVLRRHTGADCCAIVGVISQHWRNTNLQTRRRIGVPLLRYRNWRRALMAGSLFLGY